MQARSAGLICETRVWNGQAMMFQVPRPFRVAEDGLSPRHDGWASRRSFTDPATILQFCPVDCDGDVRPTPATETPTAGATEVWQIANLTGDTHPIHFHLVNVQVLGRQPFNVDSYNGTPSYTGSARDADRTELGWKETVRMNPGEVTTVIMRFDLPAAPPHVVVPSSPRTGGNEYVWHCHILEHEEHDMMRPLLVQ